MTLTDPNLHLCQTTACIMKLQLQLQSLFHASTIEITAVKDKTIPQLVGDAAMFIYPSNILQQFCEDMRTTFSQIVKTIRLHYSCIKKDSMMKIHFCFCNASIQPYVWKLETTFSKAAVRNSPTCEFTSKCFWQQKSLLGGHQHIQNKRMIRNSSHSQFQ